MIDLILDALIRANEAGKDGNRVVGYAYPRNATDDPQLILIIKENI